MTQMHLKNHNLLLSRSKLLCWSQERFQTRIQQKQHFSHTVHTGKFRKMSGLPCMSESLCPYPNPAQLLSHICTDVQAYSWTSPQGLNVRTQRVYEVLRFPLHVTKTRHGVQGTPCKPPQWIRARIAKPFKKSFECSPQWQPINQALMAERIDSSRFW